MVEDELECIACAGTWPASAFVEGPCGHAACVGCTVQILRDALRDRSRVGAGGVSCLYPACDARIDAERIAAVADLSSRLLPDARALHGAPAEPIAPLQETEAGRLVALVAAAGVPAARRLECPKCGAAADAEVTASPLRVPCGGCGHAMCARCRDAWDGHGVLFPACARPDGSAAFVDATSKGCPSCGSRITHFHGHSCHHISPSTNGCPVCGMNFCYACLSTSEENVAERGARHRCACAGGSWSNYCRSDDVAAHVVADPFPRDDRCGCPICCVCAVGAPCDQCDGTCAVCRGLIDPAPLALPGEIVAPWWSALLPAWATADDAEEEDAPDDWRGALAAVDAAAVVAPLPLPPPRASRRRPRASLRVAAASGRVGVVSRLLERSPAERRNENGTTTPLMAAAARGHAAVCAILLDAGADHARVDASRCTPLVLASRKGRPAVVALLLARGAAIDATDEHGFTPLACAAWKGHDACVEALLARGAKPAARVAGGLFEGSTPLSLARLRGHKRTACMLSLATRRAWAGLPGRRSRSLVLRAACPPARRKPPEPVRDRRATVT